MSDNKAQTFIDQAALDNMNVSNVQLALFSNIESKVAKKSNYMTSLNTGFDKKEALELCKDVK